MDQTLYVDVSHLSKSQIDEQFVQPAIERLEREFKVGIGVSVYMHLNYDNDVAVAWSNWSNGTDIKGRPWPRRVRWSYHIKITNLETGVIRVLSPAGLEILAKKIRATIGTGHLANRPKRDSIAGESGGRALGCSPDATRKPVGAGPDDPSENPAKISTQSDSA